MRIQIQIPSPVFCFIKNKEFEIIKSNDTFIVKSSNGFVEKIEFFKLLARYHQFTKWQLAPTNLRNHKLPRCYLLTQHQFLGFMPKLISDHSINLFEIKIRLSDIHKFQCTKRLILNKNYIFIRPLLKKDNDKKSKIIKTDFKSILIEMYEELPDHQKKKVLKKIKQMYRGTKRKRH